MKIVLLSFILSLLLIGGQKNTKNLASINDEWNVENISDYQGVYDFGMSEWETELILIVDNNECYGQIRSGSWKTIDGKLDWVYNFENLKNLWIAGNKFHSNKTDGVFVKEGNNKGLRLFHSWAENGMEMSSERTELDLWFRGEFAEASKRKLSLDDLRKYSSSELKIMRNEIFARYYYKFKP